MALSLATGVLWSALPVSNPDGLATLELWTGAGQPRWWSWPEFESLALDSRPPLGEVAAYTGADYNASSEPGRPPEALSSLLVSDVEGVTPAGVLQSSAGATAFLVYATGVATTPLLSALRTDARQLVG